MHVAMNLDILAGKMSFDGKKVSPDNRKGILRLAIDPVADTVVLQWLDRTVEPAVVENVWPTPVTVEEVPSAKSGKVYVVKPLDGEKQFMWIQQQDSVEALMNQIQLFSQIRSVQEAVAMYTQIFTEEVAPDQMLLDLGHHDHGDEDDEGDLEELVEQLMEQVGDDASEDDIVRMLLSNPDIMGAVLVYYLWNLSQMVQLPPAAKPAVNVAAVINAGLPHLVQADRLAELCPPGDKDIEGILKSPQFAESMKALTEGIYSDQIATLFASLGLDPTNMVPGSDPFETLCRALEDKHKKQ